MRPLALLLLVACAAEDVAPERDTTVQVIHKLGFTPIVDGLSDGFDLDGASDQCGVTDLAHPDGGDSIDNSFAALLPALDAVGGDALPELIQAAVTSGELLLLFEREVLDDGCVSTHLFRGAGAPAVGTDDFMLAGQTFDIDPEQPSAYVACGEMVDDSTYVGEGFEVRLPLQVFDESIDLTLVDGTAKIIEHEDGTLTGVLGGAVSVEEVRANVATFDGIPQELHALFGSALDVRADLLPDDTGACTHMSATLSFEAVPAFIYEDSPR
jgi:hypothetical protein